MIAWLDKNWLGNGLSLLAICISLVVALFEQRRANRDKTRAWRAEVAQRHRLIRACKSCLKAAIEQCDTCFTHIALRPSTSTVIDDVQQLKHHIEPIFETAQALQRSLPPDADLALTMARACRTLADLMGRDIGPLPLRSHLDTLLIKSRADLKRRIDQLDRYWDPPTDADDD